MEKKEKGLMWEVVNLPTNTIADWDTSNVEDMTRMFKGADKFNVDLSGWKVNKIPEEPEGFDEGATSWVLPRPNWGGSANVLFEGTSTAKVIDFGKDKPFLVEVKSGPYYVEVDGEKSILTNDDLDLLKITVDSEEAEILSSVVKEGGYLYVRVNKVLKDHKLSVSNAADKELTSVTFELLSDYDELGTIIPVYYGEIYGSNKENVLSLTLAVKDSNGEVIKGLQAEDFVFRNDATMEFVEANIAEFSETMIDEIEVEEEEDLLYFGPAYDITIVPEDDFEGNFTAIAKSSISPSTKISFTKKAIKVADGSKSTYVSLMYDPEDVNKLKLSITILNSEEEMIDNYFVKEDFVITDNVSGQELEIISCTYEDRYELLLKTPNQDKLELFAVVDGVKIDGSIKLDPYQLKSLVQEFGEYNRSKGVSNFTVKVKAQDTFKRFVKGIPKESFKPTLYSASGELIDLTLVDFKQDLVNEHYLITLTADVSFRGILSYEVDSIFTEFDNQLEIIFEAVGKQEVDYETSKLVSAVYLDPAAAKMKFTILLLDEDGDPVIDIEAKDIYIAGELFGEDVTIERIEHDVDGKLEVYGTYSQINATTFKASAYGKPLKGEVYIENPTEDLQPYQVTLSNFKEVRVLDERTLELDVDIKTIDGRFIGGLTKEQFIPLVDAVEDKLEVVSILDGGIGSDRRYGVVLKGDFYVKGYLTLKVKGKESSNGYDIEYKQFYYDDISTTDSKFTSCVRDEVELSKITATFVVKDSEGNPITNLNNGSFKLVNENTSLELNITKMVNDGEGNYTVIITDYSVADLLISATIEGFKLEETFLLEYPKEIEKPSRTVSTLQGFEIDNNRRIVKVMVASYNDENKPYHNFEYMDYKIDVVNMGDNDPVVFTTIKREEIKEGLHSGKLLFTLVADKPFTGTVAFSNEDIKIAVPTERFEYDPVNNVNYKKSKILSAEYDQYNTNLVRFTVKIVDWDEKFISNLTRTDFRVNEVEIKQDLFVVSVIEPAKDGVYELVVAFNEVRKATFFVSIHDVTIEESVTLEHPLVLSRVSTVKSTFISFPEAGTRRHIEYKVEPYNELGDLIEGLERSYFTAAFPEGSTELAFTVTKFASIYEDDIFKGYTVYIYRDKDYKGLLGIAVNAIKPDPLEEIDYKCLVELETEVDPTLDHKVPVVKRKVLKPGEFAKFHTCSEIKTNAVLDISMFVDKEKEADKKQLINVYISENAELKEPVKRDLVLKHTLVNKQELAKVVVGRSQTLYVENAGSEEVGIRVSGLEERNKSVSKAGTIATMVTNDLELYEIYRLVDPEGVYASITLSVLNTEKTSGPLKLWICDGVRMEIVDDPARIRDLIHSGVIQGDGTIVIKNITLAPNERIYIATKLKGLVVNLTGAIINAN